MALREVESRENGMMPSAAATISPVCTSASAKNLHLRGWHASSMAMKASEGTFLLMQLTIAMTQVSISAKRMCRQGQYPNIQYCYGYID
ncbi:MAG: hypothetical protein ABF581_02945 [Bifidobacterium sp.]